MRVRPCWLLACCLGCGPEPPNPTTAAASTGGPDSATTTTGPTTTGPTSSTGSGTTADTATTGAPAPVCEPLAQPMSRTLKLDGKESYQHVDDSYERACTVAESDLSAGTWKLALDCVDEADLPVSHTIEMELDPPLTAVAVAPGDGVRLRVRLFVPFWGELHLKLLDDQGGLLLAHMGAAWVPGHAPEGPEYPPNDFFAPLAVERVAVCEAECPDPPSNFIADDCCYQRDAVDFTLGGETARVYDRNLGVLGRSPAFALRVDSATSILQCDSPTDTPGAWTELMAVRLP